MYVFVRQIFSEQAMLADAFPSASQRLCRPSVSSRIRRTKRCAWDMGSEYRFLDITPKGRSENGPYHSMADWVRSHDRYREKCGMVEPNGRSRLPTSGPVSSSKAIARAALLTIVFGITAVLATSCASTSHGVSARLISPGTTSHQADAFRTHRETGAVEPLYIVTYPTYQDTGTKAHRRGTPCAFLTGREKCAQRANPAAARGGRIRGLAVG